MVQEIPSQTRLDHGLHENVVVCDVRPEVRACTQFVKQHFSADILGIRGPPQWNATTRTFPGKHCQATSDRSLSNTLLPGHVQAADFRKTIGTTHQPADHKATLMDRNRPGAMGEWRASTAFDRREMLAGVETVTLRSIKATRSRATELLSKGYTPPVALSSAVTQRAREAKAASEGDSQALELLYGVEGANAMRETMKLSAWGRKPAQRRGGRATAADLAAVAALPELPDPAAQPVTPLPQESEEQEEDSGLSVEEQEQGQPQATLNAAAHGEL